jgi:protein TonB
MPGGAPGGVLGGVLGAIGNAAPPPPPVKEEKKAAPSRIRVGGNVQQANLIRKVTPLYPPLAKQARIQGVVRFTAIIGKDGTIQNLQLVSGHPLLVEAAKQAVSQWQYKPTLLNGDPVEVVTTIEVNFTLSQ